MSGGCALSSEALTQKVIKTLLKIKDILKVLTANGSCLRFPEPNSLWIKPDIYKLKDKTPNNDRLIMDSTLAYTYIINVVRWAALDLHLDDKHGACKTARHVVCCGLVWVIEQIPLWAWDVFGHVWVVGVREHHVVQRIILSRELELAILNVKREPETKLV